MSVNEFGNVTDVKPLHEKASIPILFSDLGSITDLKLLQYINAHSPMLVSEFGNVTDVRLLQL